MCYKNISFHPFKSKLFLIINDTKYIHNILFQRKCSGISDLFQTWIIQMYLHIIIIFQTLTNKAQRKYLVGNF